MDNLSALQEEIASPSENIFLARQLQKLESLRQGVASELPILGSMIALDIVNTVVDYYINDKELTVSELWKSLSHSNTGIRIQFKRLVEGGWLETKKSDGIDSRLRLVTPTNALLDCYLNLIRSAELFFVDDG